MQRFSIGYLLARLKEPSTYAGIAAFFASFGLLGLTETDWNAIFGALAAVAGAVAVFLKDPEPQSAPASLLVQGAGTATKVQIDSSR